MNMNLNAANRARWAILTATALTFTGVLVRAIAAEPVSPSELLEKAVYSEETKGDLNAAVELYQQVVEQGKDTQAVAAQAQYRLGVCYYKNKDYAKANAAFEKVIRDYPDQKELVASAQEYLSGAVSLLPAPWGDNEELRFDVKFPTGFRIGVAVFGVHADETNAHKIWRLHSHLFAGAEQLSQTEVEADSFKPIHSRWKHTLIGDADTIYSPGHAIVSLKEKGTSKEIDLNGVIYDNEESIQLMRRLPLATNYSTTVKVLSALAGGSIIPFKVQVSAIEKVEVPAGTFECYRVELSIKQTFWFSTDAHRYLVKFEAGGVIVELTQISETKLDAPTSYHDSELKLALTAPPSWLFDRHEPDEAKEGPRIFILDPDATALTLLTAKKPEDLKPEEKGSLRALAEAGIADAAKAFKDTKAHPDSWKERTVAGQPGLSVLVDFTEGKKKKSGCVVYSFVGGRALEFLTYTDAAAFEAFRPKFDAIVDSCKMD
jgi:hypothetical protein